jgi:hypothetical protein
MENSTFSTDHYSEMEKLLLKYSFRTMRVKDIRSNRNSFIHDIYGRHPLIGYLSVHSKKYEISNMKQRMSLFFMTFTWYFDIFLYLFNPIRR